MIYEVISWSNGIGVNYELVPTKADVRGFMSDWAKKARIDKVTVTSFASVRSMPNAISRRAYVRDAKGDWVAESSLRGERRRKNGKRDNPGRRV